MERVTTKQAASELEMDLDTLQFLMRENRLPIGHANKKKGKKKDFLIISIEDCLTSIKNF